MGSIPDLSKVLPIANMTGDDTEDTALLRAMHVDARKYLESFSWCGGICESYFGLGVGGLVAVFLFRISPAKPDVDEWIWIVVGDVPPAYLTTEECPNPATALDGYIGAMTDWANAVKAGKSVRDLIPVNGAPTLDNALALEQRLKFIDEKILQAFAEDLK